MSAEGSGTGSACIPVRAVKYSILTVRSGQETAIPLLVTISMSSTLRAVLYALLIANCSLGSVAGRAVACVPGAVGAAAAGGGAGAANWPSLPTAPYALPPAGIHGLAYIFGSI